MAADRQLSVFTEWLDDGTSLFQRHHQGQIAKALPFYHPQILIELLNAGEFLLIERNLRYLLELLKGLGDLDEIKAGTNLSIVDPLTLADLLQGMPDLMLDPAPDKSNEPVFGTKEKSLLAQYLSKVQLPAMESVDTLYLMAILDTYAEVQATQGGIDNAGAKFLLSAKINTFVAKSSPLQSKGMSSYELAWALHSESEEAMIDTLLGPTPDWAACNRIGIGFWLKSPTVLRGLFDKLCKSAFLKNRDPNDAALYYLALNKKSALTALFKATKDDKLVNFFNQNFMEQRWKTAALKNAYALQAKHRFELSAAFFLLGGALSDAVATCIQKLNDPQLALCIARLQEGEEGPVWKKTLQDHVLKPSIAEDDRVLASLCYWLLRDYKSAVLTLKESEAEASGTLKPFLPSSLFLFRHLVGHVQLRDVSAEVKDDAVLVRHCASVYSRSGCSILAGRLLGRRLISSAAPVREHEQGTASVAPAPEPDPKPAETAASGGNDWLSAAATPAPAVSTGDWLSDLGAPTPAASSGGDWLSDLSSPAPAPSGGDWLSDLGAAPASSGSSWMNSLMADVSPPVVEEEDSKDILEPLMVGHIAFRTALQLLTERTLETREASGLAGVKTDLEFLLSYLNVPEADVLGALLDTVQDNLRLQYDLMNLSPSSPLTSPIATVFNCRQFWLRQKQQSKPRGVWDAAEAVALAPVRTLSPDITLLTPQLTFLLYNAIEITSLSEFLVDRPLTQPELDRLLVTARNLDNCFQHFKMMQPNIEPEHRTQIFNTTKFALFLAYGSQHLYSQVCTLLQQGDLPPVPGSPTSSTSTSARNRGRTISLFHLLGDSQGTVF